jgi:hydrogen cyanide synthase HcnC
MSKASDVVIIGGGVVGMAVAYYLSQRRGLSIKVIDVKKPGNASWASAGGLWPIGESVGLGCGVIFFKTLSKRRQENPNEPVRLERPHQLPDFFFDFCLRANALFPDLHRELLELSGVDFKLEKTGLKFIMYDDDDLAYARQIHSSIPHLAEQLRWVSQQELRAEEPHITHAAIGSLDFLRDDQVNPYLLVLAYRRAAERQGVLVLQEEVTGIQVQQGRVVAVEAGGQTIPCGLVINAAGAWAAQLASMVGVSIPIVPVRGQVVLSERLPKTLLKSCLSTSDCYIAQKDNGEVLIGSTTEHVGFDPVVTLPQLKSLITGAVKAIPSLANVHVKRTWAGLRPGTPYEIPFLGPVEGLEGYLNACGHFRTGILTSTITGQILQALVFNEPTPVPLEPFLHKRFSEARAAA